ncbi:MAG: hypothetical protein ACO1QB_04545 [Verrucomicrobiales bacterium]
MKVVQVKTVRFAKLVESSGKPYAKTLWFDPESDTQFKKAIRQNRVLTVAQANVGQKKDVGIIGFLPDKRGAILVFPKSIPYDSGARVIGIKWDLVEEPPPADPVDWTKIKKKTSSHRAPSSTSVFTQSSSHPASPANNVEEEPLSPPLKKFNVSIEIHAVQQITTMVEAHSLKEAKARALESQAPLDLSGAKVTRKVRAAHLSS